jgi:hypothetical protein
VTLWTQKFLSPHLSPPPHGSPLSLSQLEPELKTIPLTPVEMEDMELDTSYEVSGRCRVEEEDLWGEWSPVLSFQTPPSGEDRLTTSLGPAPPGNLTSQSPLTCPHPSSSLPAPKDVWVSKSCCLTSCTQEPLLLWKVRCEVHLHFFAGVRTPPNNDGRNNTLEPTVLSFIYLFFVVLGFELRAYTLSHSTSPFFCDGRFSR